MSMNHNRITPPGNHNGLVKTGAMRPSPNLNRNDADPPATGWGGGGFGAEGWRRHLWVLRKHKWLLIAITLFGTLAGLVISAVTRPEYESEVRLWVEGAGPEGGGEGPLQAGAFLEAYDWVDLLHSYAVLEHVVRDRGLFVAPKSSRDRGMLAGFVAGEEVLPGEYELRATEGGGWALWTGDSLLVEEGRAGEPVGSSAGFQWTPSPAFFEGTRSIQFDLVQPRDVARRLAEDLEVRMLEQGSFMYLRLTGDDPVRVAETLNAIAERFLAVAADLQSGQTAELEERLAEQLGTAELQLFQAEAALEEFRTRTATTPTASLPGSELGPAEMNYFEVLYDRDRVRRDRRALEEVLASAPDPGSLPVFLEAVPVTAESAELMGRLEELREKRRELQTLNRTYTSVHPEVQTLEEEIRTLEGRTIPSLAGQLAEAMATREGELDAEVAQQSSRISALPAIVTEGHRLERTANIAAELFTLLKTRYETARVARASGTSRIQVLDRAEAPRFPITDFRNRILLFSIMASLGAGVMGTLLVDRWDPRIRYPEEISDGMGLSILGTIPLLKLAGPRMEGAIAEEATEAFRGLRLNLAYAHGAAGPVMTAITSPGPGDGKSFVSMNLALSYSKIGMRTLLVDGDIRRGRLHRTLQLPRKPGLIDYLAGTASIHDVCRRTAYSGLDLIPAGVRQKDAPELLSSGALNRLFAEVKENYDVILIDTAPLGVGVDPLLFAALAGNLILVVRSGATIREFTESKVAHLSRLPIRVLGAVMNAVPPTSAYPYYYYYFPEYSPSQEEALPAST